jgi:hypothetical protein
MVEENLSSSDAAWKPLNMQPQHVGSSHTVPGTFTHGNQHPCVSIFVPARGGGMGTAAATPCDLGKGSRNHEQYLVVEIYAERKCSVLIHRDNSHDAACQ